MTWTEKSLRVFLACNLLCLLVALLFESGTFAMIWLYSYPVGAAWLLVSMLWKWRKSKGFGKHTASS